jgi:hypothetical protein
MNDELLTRLVAWVYAMVGVADPTPKLVSATKSLILAIFGFVAALAGGYELGVFDTAQPFFGAVAADPGVVGRAYGSGALMAAIFSFGVNLLLKILSR